MCFEFQIFSDLVYLHLHNEPSWGKDSSLNTKLTRVLYLPYTQGPKVTVYSISNNFVHESEVSRCRILQLGHEVRALRVPVFEALQMLVGISDGALYLRTRSYYGTRGTEPFPRRVGFVTAFYGGGASLPEGHEDPSLLVC